MAALEHPLHETELDGQTFLALADVPTRFGRVSAFLLHIRHGVADHAPDCARDPAVFGRRRGGLRWTGAPDPPRRDRRSGSARGGFSGAAKCVREALEAAGPQSMTTS